jgi:hypothetical protein
MPALSRTVPVHAWLALHPMSAVATMANGSVWRFISSTVPSLGSVITQFPRVVEISLDTSPVASGCT